MRFLIIIFFYCYQSSAQSITTYLYDPNGNLISKQIRGSSPNPMVTASPEAVNPAQPSTLTATGCTGGNVQWIPGNLQGSQVTVSQSVTTQYTASCIVSGCTTNGTGKVTVSIIDCPTVTISVTANTNIVRYGGQVLLNANGCNIVDNGVNIGKVTWSTGAVGSRSSANLYGSSTVYTATCSTPYCANISTAYIIIGGISGCSTGDVIISKQIGNWDDPNTWICGKIPTINDEVFINHQVNVNVIGYAKKLIKGEGYLVYDNNATILLP